MARIRSVHPGLWTDERFASVSALARLLFIGIWTECDDAGSFEWSPIKLKMRILPVDNVDAAELLEELRAANCIMGYELEGRKLGAVRNFTAFQRPKKPNLVYPQSDAVRNYCGFKGGAVPPKSEKSPQMEEGGGNRSSEPNGSGAAPPSEDSDKQFWDTAKAYIKPEVKGDPGSVIGKWARDYGKREAAAAITRAQVERPIQKVQFIEGCLRQSKRAQEQQPAVPL